MSTRVIPCFVAARGRASVCDRAFIPDGQGGRLSGGQVSNVSRDFLATKMRLVPNLNGHARNINLALQSLAVTTIVGMLLLSAELESGTRLELENFDSEARLWYELEGPIHQRAGFHIVRAAAFAEPLPAVPAKGVADLQHPFFLASVATQQACFQQAISVVHAWGMLGHQVAIPLLVTQMLPAVASLCCPWQFEIL